MSQKKINVLCSFCLALSACASTSNIVNLMSDIQTDSNVPETELSVQNISDLTDFSVQLFQYSLDDSQNILVSPFSMISALAMSTNGAKNQTQKQMEDTFQMPISELNQILYSYTKQLSSNHDGQLNSANSIWIKDDPKLTVEQDFLETNANYYQADIFKASFDLDTCNEINRWVKEKTKGRIENIIDGISDEAILYLINALSFDATWHQGYQSNQIQTGLFTTENGTTQRADFMYGKENQYLEDSMATGFMKYYQNGEYAFVALLPNEDISLSEYVASLDGNHLYQLLHNPNSIEVETAIPKFKAKHSQNMEEVLQKMGIIDAFDPEKADFSALGTYQDANICISKVLHQTSICVDEKGTMAGAATAIEMVKTMSLLPDQTKSVYLTRPFVYMIIDTKNQLPIFMGTLTDLEN